MRVKLFRNVNLPSWAYGTARSLKGLAATDTCAQKSTVRIVLNDPEFALCHALVSHGTGFGATPVEIKRHHYRTCGWSYCSGHRSGPQWNQNRIKLRCRDLRSGASIE